MCRPPCRAVVAAWWESQYFTAQEQAALAPATTPSLPDPRTLGGRERLSSFPVGRASKGSFGGGLRSAEDLMVGMH